VGPRRGDVRLVALTALAPAVVIRHPKHDKMIQLSLTGRGLLRYAQPIWKCIDHNQSLVGEGVCLCPVSARAKPNQGKQRRTEQGHLEK